MFILIYLVLLLIIYLFVYLFFNVTPSTFLLLPFTNFKCHYYSTQFFCTFKNGCGFHSRRIELFILAPAGSPFSAYLVDTYLGQGNQEIQIN